MTITYKVLGQVAPAAITNTTLYTVPSATQAVISTICICNTGLTSSFRIAIRPAGAALVSTHYIAYDTAVNQYDSVFLTFGGSLAATDVITVYSATNTLSFSVFGSEIS